MIMIREFTHHMQCLLPCWSTRDGDRGEPLSLHELLLPVDYADVLQCKSEPADVRCADPPCGAPHTSASTSATRELTALNLSACSCSAITRCGGIRGADMRASARSSRAVVPTRTRILRVFEPLDTGSRSACMLG